MSTNLELWKTMKSNLELYRVVMGGYRRLQGGSDDFLWQTDRHFIIIYKSSLSHNRLSAWPRWNCRDLYTVWAADTFWVFPNITVCTFGAQSEQIWISFINFPDFCQSSLYFFWSKYSDLKLQKNHPLHIYPLVYLSASGHSSDPDHHHDHPPPPRWTLPWVLVQSAMLSETASQPMMAPACQVNNIHIDPHRLKKIQSRMTNIRLQITNDKLWWWTGAPPPPPLISFCRGSAVPPIVSSGPDMLLLFRCPCCFVSITFPIIVLPVSASATLHICSHSFTWSFFPLLDRHLLPLRVPRLFASTDLSSRWCWYNPLKDKLGWGLRISQVEIDFVDSESGRFSPRDRLSGDLDCRFTFTSVARRQVFMNVIKLF